MSTLPVEQRLTELWERPKTVRGWFVTVDHRATLPGVFFLLVGGLEALLMRIQLVRTGTDGAWSGQLKSDLFHARHHHDFLVRRANPFRLCRVPGSTDSRAPETWRFLD